MEIGIIQIWVDISAFEYFDKCMKLLQGSFMQSTWKETELSFFETTLVDAARGVTQVCISIYIQHQ